DSPNRRNLAEVNQQQACQEETLWTGPIWNCLSQKLSQAHFRTIHRKVANRRSIPALTLAMVKVSRAPAQRVRGVAAVRVASNSLSSPENRCAMRFDRC